MFSYISHVGIVIFNIVKYKIIVCKFQYRTKGKILQNLKEVCKISYFTQKYFYLMS